MSNYNKTVDKLFHRIEPKLIKLEIFSYLSEEEIKQLRNDVEVLIDEYNDLEEAYYRLDYNVT